MKIFYQIILELLAICNFSEGDFGDEGLDLYNKLREKHRVSPLIRNSTLDKCAQDCAERLVKNTKKFAQHTRNGNYGETMSMINLSTISDSQMVKMGFNLWKSGKYSYNFKKPEVLKGRAPQFTQMIWKNTKNIGFGVARSSSATFICAEYDPPGNTRESFPENVLKE